MRPPRLDPIKRGSTYPIMIDVPGYDLTQAEKLRLIFSPEGLEPIVYERDDLSVAADADGSAVLFLLSEQQSLALDTRTAIIDMNWVIDGERGGITPVSVQIANTIDEEEL